MRLIALIVVFGSLLGGGLGAITGADVDPRTVACDPRLIWGTNGVFFGGFVGCIVAYIFLSTDLLSTVTSNRDRKPSCERRNNGVKRKTTTKADFSS
jgi:hypothetical protein